MFGDREMKGYLKKSVLMLVGLSLSLGVSSQVLAQVSLEDISFVALPGDRFEVKMSFSDSPPAPEGYTIDSPARIVLDLPGVTSDLERKHSLSFENARSAVLLGTSDRTRLILNMQQMAPYETSVTGNVMTMVVGASEGVARTEKKTVAQAVTTSRSKPAAQDFSLKSVDFRRGEKGEGLVIVGLSDPSVSVDITQTAGDIKLSFFRTSLPEELAPLRTEFIKIKYADARELYELFDVRRNGGGGGGGGRNATDSMLSNRGSAIVDDRTNTIILTDTEDKIRDFMALIEEIDIPIRQVLIEARIVIANTDFRKEIGARLGIQGARTPDSSDFGFGGSIENFESPYNPIQVFNQGGGTILVNDAGLGVDLGVNNPTGSFAIELLTQNTFLDLELSALENEGTGEIVSQPKVLTGDKQKASIKTGTEVPYQNATSSGATSVQFKEAVLKLEVTPQITPDGRIVMDINVNQDSIGDILPTGEPVIDVTQVETKAIVGDGQTLVLGGLFQMSTVDTVEKVPFFGDIPYLGRLFRKDLDDMEKREILVFITPKILSEALLD